MPELIASKSLIYGTRRLKAGDIFTARTKTDARALIAIGKASLRAATPKYVPVDPRKASIDDTHEPAKPAPRKAASRKGKAAK